MANSPSPELGRASLCNTLNLGYKLLYKYQPNSGVTLVSLYLSLFLLARIKLIRREINYLFCQDNVSHEMLHHAALKICFKLLHMFELV
jgi:hypothetical protein